jgi:hypothetical protein
MNSHFSGFVRFGDSDELSLQHVVVRSIVAIVLTVLVPVELC